MKANQLATLVLRLLGIYCLIVFIPFVSVFGGAIFYAGSTHDNSGITAIIVAVLSLVFWLGVGILLIAYSVPLGKKLTPKDIGEGNISAISFEQAQVLAFAVAGVLIFAEALPQLLNSLSSLLMSLNQGNGRIQYSPNAAFNWHGLLTAGGTILKAALGLCLFFGAHGFANFWRSLRNFGTPKPPAK